MIKLNEIVNDLPSLFGSNEEQAIISMMLDYPDFFAGLIDKMEYTMFKKPECQYIFAQIKESYDKHQVIITRGMLIDSLKRQLTVDDSCADELLKVASAPSNMREVPIIKSKLIAWAKKSSYERLYLPDAIKKFHEGEYDHITNIINESEALSTHHYNCVDFLDYTSQMEIDVESEHFTTGIRELDIKLNMGPGRKEILMLLAPTSGGKSIALHNMALINAERGAKVLFISFEMSIKSLVNRMIATTSNLPSKAIKACPEILEKAKKIAKATQINLKITEQPSDTWSVNDIKGLINNLDKLHSWKPDIIVIDYLELMRNRNKSLEETYGDQKAIATQLRGLAQETDTLVITATQSNRAGMTAARTNANLDIDKMAESYGKAMTADYIVSMNQEPHEKEAGQLRLFIAKNRLGECKETVIVNINYDTFKIKEAN